MSIPLIFKGAKESSKAADEAHVDPPASSDQPADHLFASL